jgi:hypothetical protein
VPDKRFAEYRLVGGAEEIEVEVVVAGVISLKGSQFIRVDAESYSVQRNTISNILSKKFYAFGHSK